MKKDILLVAHFCSDFDGKGNNRFNYLANLFVEDNFNVELVTSDFSHSKKVKRDKVNKTLFKYDITYIHEPSYKKNVSFKRFYSHYIMSRNLEKYLLSRKKPDKIYCAVPSLDVAKVVTDYAASNNIELIIDIQDLWPEAFKMLLNISWISNFLFYPFQKRADYIYSSADEIIAVSNSYIQKAKKLNTKVQKAYTVYLGTELGMFDELAKKNKIEKNNKDEIWIAYIGTLGHSYDLKTVIDALKIIKDKGINNIKFIVMGDGPLKKNFEEYAHKKGVSTEFTGRLEYGKMVGILKECDIAVNPIKKGSAGSIINKVGDYAAAGLPVVNNQECIEYRLLLENYNSGLNCRNGDSVDFANKLLNLCSNKKLRVLMGHNSRKLAEDKFDRKKTYRSIISLLK